MMEEEMVGWHHRLNEHEFEQSLGDDEGQGSLVCCSPWGHEESDTTEALNNNAGDAKNRFDPWVRKIPGVGNGNLLQYSCLE